MNSSPLLSDIAAMKPLLSALKTNWDGKECVLEMKEANYQWRQMEWFGWYFELICKKALAGIVTFPGDKFGKVGFDLKRSINWDLKAKAIRSDSHGMILNDQRAIDASVSVYGQHGVVVGLCDVEYNDANRSFQAWHTALKGGLSKYEIARIERTSISRYRKTHVWLVEIVFLSINRVNLPMLDIHHQGRNANGKAREPKYELDLENVQPFLIDKFVFSQA